MATLNKKIDFIGFIVVDHANPNGDPLNGNQPREDYDGYGEISDVCLKRKLRNRLQDAGESILVQSNERVDDGYDSIRSRVGGNPAMEKPLKMKDKEKGRIRLIAEEAAKAWFDVRAFGQVFALKAGTGVDAVSVGVRGPVTIHTAVSLDPVTITGVQITKSVNNEPGDKKGSDTMGMKYRVDFGVYKVQGSINVQFYWIEHHNKTGAASSAKVHRSVEAHKKDGVDMPKSLGDYTFNDSALYALSGVRIEKYIEGSKVE